MLAREMLGGLLDRSLSARKDKSQQDGTEITMEVSVEAVVYPSSSGSILCRAHLESYVCSGRETWSGTCRTLRQALLDAQPRLEAGAG